MFIDLPGEVVQNLVITVNAMTWHAASGAKLGDSTDQHDGEARVKWRGSIAQGGAGRCAKADRTRGEVLVRRKEPFGEAVPSITQFVHLVGSYRPHVGNRYQLHTGRRVGVEPRQLTAGGGQRQLEGLHAVSKEITPREVVVGVETVVDLRDKTGQPIE